MPGNVAKTPRGFVTEFAARLAVHPPSASYSVAPLVGGRVLDLPFHARRCFDSARLLRSSASGNADGDDGPAADWDRYLDALRGALPSASALAPPAGLLTICASRGPDDWQVASSVFGMELGRLSMLSSARDPMADAVTVDLTRSIQRNVPAAKAARWTLDRVPAETARHSTAAETIILAADNDGDELLEGLVSNLFVWRGSQLETAPAGRVLSGSMASLVERLAAKMGLSVVHQAPRLSEAQSWDAAIITSATKPAVPIGRVLDPSGRVIKAFPRVLPAPLSELILLLREGVYGSGSGSGSGEQLLAARGFDAPLWFSAQDGLLL